MAPGGIRQMIVGLDKKHNIFKLAKFAIASVTGFLLAEGILTLGVFLLYGKLSAPDNAYSSSAFLPLDAAALALGVALAFFLNERFTVRVQRAQSNGGSSGLPIRLLKFEGVNAMGNVAIVVVQFVLLSTLSVAPAIGSIVGAVVAYPITYLVSMRFVWKPAAAGPIDDRPTHLRNQPRKEVGPLSSPVPAVLFVVSLYVIGQILQRRRR